MNSFALDEFHLGIDGGGEIIYGHENESPSRSPVSSIDALIECLGAPERRALGVLLNRVKLGFWPGSEKSLAGLSEAWPQRERAAATLSLRSLQKFGALVEVQADSYRFTQVGFEAAGKILAQSKMQPLASHPPKKEFAFPIRNPSRREFDWTASVHRVLQKVDGGARKRVVARIEEILEDPENKGKSMLYDLSVCRETHLLNSFVLTYSVVGQRGKVVLIALAHHDEIQGWTRSGILEARRCGLIP